jgi:hypothetical protein
MPNIKGVFFLNNLFVTLLINQVEVLFRLIEDLA